MFEKIIRFTFDFIIFFDISVFFLIVGSSYFRLPLIKLRLKGLFFTLGKIGILIFFLLVSAKAEGQTSPSKILTMDEAVKKAVTNNPIAKNSELKVRLANSQKLTVVNFGNTEVNYQYGQLFSSVKDNYFEVVQNFGSPVTLSRKGNYVKEVIKLSESEQKLAIKQLTVEVKSVYMNLIYQRNRLRILNDEARFYSDFIRIVGLYYGSGETNLLDKSMAETLYADIQNQQFQAEQDYHIATNHLQQVVYTSDNLLPADSTLEMYSIHFKRVGPDKFLPLDHLSYYEGLYDVRHSELLLERSKFFPEIHAGYFNHEIEKAKGFDGFKVGISFPLWFLPQKAKTSEARINLDIAHNEFEYQKFTIDKTIENLKFQLDKLFVQISYFRENALNQADIMIKTASVKFSKQEIEYLEYLQSISAARKIKLDYLETVRQYNLSAIQLEYYIN